MTDALADLSDAGVAVWLDDLSRERLRTGNLAELVDDTLGRRGDHQPVDLPEGAVRRRGLRRAGPRPRAARHRRRRGGARADDLRRPLGLRRAAPGLRPRPTASTAGSPSRSTRGSATTPTAPSPRPRRCGGWSTGRTSTSRSRRRVEGLAAITRTLAEGISVNVTLIFSLRALRRGDGRVPRRAGAGEGQRPRPVPDRLGRAASSSAASTPRSTSGSATDSTAARQGGARQRPAGLPALRGRSSPATAGRRSRRPARSRSARCGPRPASRTRRCDDTLYVVELVAPGTVNTMPEKTLQAVADHGEVTRRHRHRHLRRGAAGPRRPRGGRRRLRRRRRSCSRTRAWRSSRRPGASSSSR